MTFWFNKKIGINKRYCSKSFSIRYYLKHWRLLQCKTNGARKGVDSCYDLNIYILGLFIGYTNWDYNS